MQVNNNLGNNPYSNNTPKYNNLESQFRSVENTSRYIYKSGTQ